MNYSTLTILIVLSWRPALTQAIEMYSYPIEDINIVSAPSNYKDFSESPLLIPLVDQMREIENPDLSTPQAALISIFSAVSVESYQKLLYSRDIKTRLTKDYFSNFAKERDNLTVELISVITTILNNKSTAFVKYNVVRFDDQRVTACYAFGEKEGSWRLLNENNHQNISLALSFAKNETIANLLKGEGSPETFQETLNESATTLEGVNLVWFSEYISNLVLNRELRKEEFEELCKNPNWKN